MRLGTETGSIVNHLMAGSKQPTPVVGMGATILLWTDRHAATVFRVFAVGKTPYIEIREDKARRVDSNGMSEEQDYEFKTNPSGSRSTWRLGRSGDWERVEFNQQTRRWSKSGGRGLLLGHRDSYHDFSF